MRLYEANLGDRESACAYVLGISDLHVGDPNFNEKYLRRLVEWVKDTPEAYVILNGDLANCATKTSKSDTYEETMNPNEQRKYLKAELAPLKGRVLGITEGNHEWRVRKDTSIDICEELAESLGCPYGREGLALKITLGKDKHGKRIAYTGYATHGWSMARTIGSKANTLTSLANVILADFYIMGHSHEKMAIQRDYLVPDPQNGVVRQVKQLFANSGACLDFGGYAVSRGYRPGAKGIPRIRLDGRRKDVHCSI